MSKLFDLVDEAPLFGKLFIREMMCRHRLAGKENERKAYGQAVGALSLMIGGHALQAYIGAGAFSRTIAGNTMLDAVGAGIGGVYAAVNTAVTLRQAELLGRTHTLHKGRLREGSQLYERQPVASRSREMGHRGIKLAVASTLLGQILSCGTIIYARHEHERADCLTGAAQYYSQYTQTHPDAQFESLDDYEAHMCRG